MPLQAVTPYMCAPRPARVSCWLSLIPAKRMGGKAPLHYYFLAIYICTAVPQDHSCDLVSSFSSSHPPWKPSAALFDMFAMTSPVLKIAQRVWGKLFIFHLLLEIKWIFQMSEAWCDSKAKASGHISLNAVLGFQLQCTLCLISKRDVSNVSVTFYLPVFEL